VLAGVQFMMTVESAEVTVNAVGVSGGLALLGIPS
jgi:hypothetical protein